MLCDQPISHDFVNFVQWSNSLHGLEDCIPTLARVLERDVSKQQTLMTVLGSSGYGASLSIGSGLNPPGATLGGQAGHCSTPAIKGIS